MFINTDIEKFVTMVTKTMNEVKTQITQVVERQNTLIRDLEHIVEDIKELKICVDKLDKKWIVEESKNLVSGKVRSFISSNLVSYAPWILALLGLLGFGGEQLYKMPSPDQQQVIEKLQHK